MANRVILWWKFFFSFLAPWPLFDRFLTGNREREKGVYLQQSFWRQESNLGRQIKDHSFHIWSARSSSTPHDKGVIIYINRNTLMVIDNTEATMNDFQFAPIGTYLLLPLPLFCLFHRYINGLVTLLKQTRITFTQILFFGTKKK